MSHAEKRPSQTQRILDLMSDRQHRTLGQIVEAIGSISEAGASARLRDIRKLGWVVDRKQIGKHFFSYSVRPMDEQGRLAI